MAKTAPIKTPSAEDLDRLADEQEELASRPPAPVLMPLPLPEGQEPPPALDVDAFVASLVAARTVAQVEELANAHGPSVAALHASAPELHQQVVFTMEAHHRRVTALEKIPVLTRAARHRKTVRRDSYVRLNGQPIRCSAGQEVVWTDAEIAAAREQGAVLDDPKDGG